MYKKFEFVGYVFLILQYVCFQYKTDASNVYDEEVFDAKEMYFSDDEEEGQFKQRSKRKGGNKSEDSVKSGKSNYSHQRTKHNNHNLHRQSKFEQPTRHHVSHPQHQIPPPPPQMFNQSPQHYQYPPQYQYPPAYHSNGMHPSQYQYPPMYYNNGMNVTYPMHQYQQQGVGAPSSAIPPPPPPPPPSYGTNYTPLPGYPLPHPTTGFQNQSSHHQTQTTTQPQNDETNTNDTVYYNYSGN